jgi:hypothetical protein
MCEGTGRGKVEADALNLADIQGDGVIKDKSSNWGSSRVGDRFAEAIGAVSVVDVAAGEGLAWERWSSGPTTAWYEEIWRSEFVPFVLIMEW